jgi:hypothetical protein
VAQYIPRFLIELKSPHNIMDLTISRDLRVEALKRFAFAITVLNLAGHLFLGFESSWMHPIVALLTTYSLEITFEFLEAYFGNRRPKYLGGLKKFILFLLPAHITAMAVSMLLFTNQGLLPMIFASSAAVLSKVIFRVRIGGIYRHFLNPSNTGIGVTLILLPWVGISPPYQFTENVAGVPDLILPLIFIGVGSLLNLKLTKRMPLILAWFGGIIIQAFCRSVFFDDNFLAAIGPLSGVSFILFSFYMISDPATTPANVKYQVLFGFFVSMLYGILVINHIVFGQFFALLIVCLLRGIYFFLRSIFSIKQNPIIQLDQQFIDQSETLL